ncbi:MAG: NAD-dependent epimerase/dehydratase family protein [Pseudonocardia sp.]|nr:NAD-dependent epimerase/dehydratase family protein [Pseudonocardia sp.]
MDVLVIGVTGYIGAAVSGHLTAAGHRVIALTRSAATAPDTRRGDLTDPRSLVAAVTPDIDAVIHVGSPTDATTDLAAVRALAEPLHGTGRVLIYTSGTWVLGPTGVEPVDEDAVTDAIDIVGHRPEVERHALDTAAHGVRSSMIRPGVAHGRGGGIPAILVGLAAEHGGGRYVGPAGVRWPMVHVADLADLYVAAPERAPAGTLLHGVGRGIGAGARPRRGRGPRGGRRRGGASPAPRRGAARFGAPFADALALDQAVSGTRARHLLRWNPYRDSAEKSVTGTCAVGSRARTA